jgi:hypothetical protein
MKNIIIGLKGDRGVGKTEIARYLVENHGFTRVHPFDGGKAASRAYFMYLGATEEMAHRMTDGDLKDVSSPVLPVIENPEHVEPGKYELGDHYSPRFFMEKFGKCMGVDMGPGFTIVAELKRHLEKDPGTQKRLIVESIVYEAPHLKAIGGTIIDVVREVEGVERPKGVETDKFGKSVTADLTFNNNCENIDAMYQMLDDFLVSEFELDDHSIEMAM